MLSGLIGRAIKEGEQIDPEKYIGSRYMVVVVPSQSGGTRVEVISPIAAA
jgi:hypothetical protein